MFQSNATWENYQGFDILPRNTWDETEMSNADDINSGVTTAFNHETHAKTKFICHICSKQFGHETSLKDHQARHISNEINLDDNNALRCRVCFKWCKNEISLRDHEAIHRIAKPGRWVVRSNICKVCFVEFQNMKSRNQHIMMHHTGELEVGNSCKICGTKFRLSRKLRRHMKIRHSGEKLPRREPKKHSCKENENCHVCSVWRLHKVDCPNKISSTDEHALDA